MTQLDLFPRVVEYSPNGMVIVGQAEEELVEKVLKGRRP